MTKAATDFWGKTRNSNPAEVGSKNTSSLAGFASKSDVLLRRECSPAFSVRERKQRSKSKIKKGTKKAMNGTINRQRIGVRRQRGILKTRKSWRVFRKPKEKIATSGFYMALFFWF